jgi:hypothetical protein
LSQEKDFTWLCNSSNAFPSSFASSFISLMDEMELAGLDDFAGPAAEDRERGVAFAGAVAFIGPVTLGLEGGPFFTASDTEARGRTAGVAAFAEPTEPVGETTVLRTGTLSGAGFALVEEDNDCLTAGGAVVFTGATDALRLEPAATIDGLEDTEEAIDGLELARGADVVGFLIGGAVALEAAVAGA